MAKPKIMNFVDGPREIAVGDKVVYTNGQFASHHRVSESTVEKIGRELVHLKSRNVFYLENGREKSEYSPGVAYSSIDAYNEQVRRNKFVSTLQLILRNHRMTYDQAVKIAEVLGLTEEQLNSFKF